MFDTITTHQHPKFGAVTLADEHWNLVTPLIFEGVDVPCQLVDMSSETPTADVIPRLDVMAMVLDDISDYVDKAQEALTTSFAASEDFAPWVNSLRRTLREIMGLGPNDELTPEGVAGAFRFTALRVNADIRKHKDYEPSCDPMFPDFEIELREAVPAETSDYFHDIWDIDEYRTQLQAGFPNMKDPHGATADQISDAIWMNRIMLSLATSGSGGATLSMDYKILPVDEEYYEDNVFCASFAPNGDFLEVS